MGLGDFKRVAGAAKSLLTWGIWRVCQGLWPHSHKLRMLSGRLHNIKKTAPKGGLKGVLQRGPGLEVEAPASVEHVEIVDRFANALELAVRRNREVTRNKIEVGVEVLIGGIEMEGC